MAAEAALAEDLKGNNAQGANPSQNLEEPPVVPSAKSHGLQEPSKSYISSSSSAFQKGPQESKDDAVSAGADDLPVSSVQKKILRAERFGISVQLSEQEKRNCRAERFGTGPTLNKSDGFNKSEERKRKERAERFGLPSVSVPNDAEAKKKARQARFATGSETDSIEENKRKARVARFSDPPLKSESQINGKDSIHRKLAFGGKGGEES